MSDPPVDAPLDTRVVGLLELLLVEQRKARHAQESALAQQACALALQKAYLQRALRAFAALVLASGTIAALVRAWPSLAWLASS